MSDVTDWWTTSIIDMEPGRIDIRGQAIENLIGNMSFVEMIFSGLNRQGHLPLWFIIGVLRTPEVRATIS